jgi:putative polyhydroxyalkanoate system protein
VADIHIVREHGLGLEKARKLAFRWAEEAEKKLEMDCTYEEGKTHDEVKFHRAGASGHLKVSKDRFELSAKLGLLLGVFKHKIETEIVRNLDEMLAHDDPLYAFNDGVHRHEAKHAEKHVEKHAKHHDAHKPAAKKPAAKNK